jgi:hypothetical protein
VLHPLGCTLPSGTAPSSPQTPVSAERLSNPWSMPGVHANNVNTKNETISSHTHTESQSRYPRDTAAKWTHVAPGCGVALPATHLHTRTDVRHSLASAANKRAPPHRMSSVQTTRSRIRTRHQHTEITPLHLPAHQPASPPVLHRPTIPLFWGDWSQSHVAEAPSGHRCTAIFPCGVACIRAWSA